jgi:hypothetical protein
MNQKNNGNNKMNYSFILFTLLSVVFWFMTKLSKEYDSTIAYPISYKNLPDDKLLQEAPLDFIKIHIKTTGFKLILAKISPNKLEINASNIYYKSLTDYYLLVSQQKLALQKQMETGVQIDHFIHDSITFNLGLLKIKKVPVKLLSDFTYADGYELNEPISITPDSIIVTGPESILDTISFVSTILLQKKELSASINESIAVKEFASESNVNIQQENIEISAAIEKFTEGTIELPFRILNLPPGKTINTFPKFVKITYRIALSNFNKISPSSFLIECDYNMSKENNLPYLIPKIVETSFMIKNARIAPLKIDFIISK